MTGLPNNEPAIPDDEIEVDYDFDEAWRERKAARVAPRVRILGKVYTLPNSLPAKLILFAVAARKNGRAAADEVDAEEAFDMLSALLGEANLIDIMQRGLEIDDLPDLLDTCQRVYRDRQERPGGKAQAPALRIAGATGSTPSA
ncbi:hypothetical protein [Nocardia arthritidis]|uniref:Tail assembly chaperone n=1 Tax=Nocardia arthritidis TaxID=228602 RepID=A0A6G9YKM6_9NOCA|nr:hypothetical protein [Nocardia arthritidis]QIS13586.1 hypothetical protein F5544_28675 [Nocardia arthritidis]